MVADGKTGREERHDRENGRADTRGRGEGAPLAAGMRGVVRVGYRSPRVIRKTRRLAGPQQ